jgi:hypothetical protein
MQIKITDVSVEEVKKGKSSYKTALVAYTQNGEAKEKKIVDFSNPKVFAAVQDNIGNDVDVKVVKEGQYWQWVDVTSVGASSGNSGSNQASPANRVTGSNYETREERAARQVYIVKQSSLSAAVETLKIGATGPLDPTKVIEVAEQYKTYVFDNE